MLPKVIFVLVLTAARSLPFTSSVELAECYAADWAVLLASEQRWSHIVVEGDAALIIQALHGSLLRGLHEQVILHNVISRVENFDSISFSFCYRECNEVANRLAHWASSSSCDNVWLGYGPTWISDIVISDISA